MVDLTTLVIFGASGDLTRRKLIPSLFSLYEKGRLPEPFKIVGFALTEWDDEIFRRTLIEGMEELAGRQPDPAAWERFSANLHYQSGSFTEAGDVLRLGQRLESLEGGPAIGCITWRRPPVLYRDRR